MNSDVHTPDVSRSDARKPSRIPVLLSGFLFPGAGQLVQRRWGPAAGFSVGFVACFVIFVGYVFTTVRVYYGLAFDPTADAQATPPLWKPVTALGVAFCVYVVSLVDTFSAYRQACTQWREDRFRRSLGR